MEPDNINWNRGNFEKHSIEHKYKIYLNCDITSTCNIFNSFGNKEIYCQAMSGIEYNKAGETGPRVSGRMNVFVSMPCSIRFFFFPYFHKKQQQQQQKSRVLRDEYFSSFLNWKQKGFLGGLLSEQKRKYAGSSRRIFFEKLLVLSFFYWKHKGYD